jgi:hypothetical protein
MTFERWLADLFRRDVSEITALIRDKTAFRFLIVWSIFEAKCFRGLVRIKELDEFSQRLVADRYNVDELSRIVSHFHSGYQDKALRSNLMHKQSSERFEKLLGQPIEELSQEERVFLLSIVIYRYRNNMFHGNKGVQSWLQFQKQIAACIEVMQSFITHVESVSPSIPEREAA